jgi:hypothetical protein
MKYQTEVSAEGLAEDPTGFTTNTNVKQVCTVDV